MPNNEYAMGRLPDPDARDANYPMRAALTAAPEPQQKYWYFKKPTLNQLTEPKCVGFSWRAWMQASPVIYKQPEPSAHVIYREAQSRDPWRAQPHEGSTVRAAAEYLSEVAHVSQYLWAFDAETVIKYLLTQGPVVLGTDWYESMFNVTRKGFAKVDVASGRAGGHAYLAIGASRKKKAVRIQNSWGDRWAQGGRAWISFDDLGTLLAGEDAEACTATQREVV